MQLSVLISSTHARRYQHQRLLGQLREQAAQLPEHKVQILVLLDDGEAALSVKEKALMSAAVHHNTIVLDDSTDLSPTYLADQFRTMRTVEVKEGAKPAKK